MITAKPVKRTKFTAVVNGRRKAKKHAARSSGAPRRNPAGATLLLGYLNPEKKRVMKAKKTKKIRRKANPIQAKVFKMKPWHKNGKRPRRKNPIASGLVGRSVELLKAGAIGAIAYFITRQVPKWILKEKDQSYLGYLSNLITAIASSALAERYFGPAAGQAAFVGGGMYLVGRVAADKAGYQFGLSGIVPGYWAQPPSVTKDGTPVFPQQLKEFIQAQIPAPTPAAVPASAKAGVAGGRLGRF